MQTVRLDKPKPYLTVRETAELLGLHEVTVRRKVLEGIIPAYRTGPKGSAVRIDRLELEAWLRRPGEAA
jgi:excisionase family DNA binding protein